MNVVSLFDGISCAFQSLKKINISIKSYTAYEIDRYAIQISKTNHPEIIHQGDVRTLTEPIPCDLLIGGSPCTDLSLAKQNRKGLEGEKSKLFFEYVRILRLLKPKYFILENVYSMPSKDRDIITEHLGVNPIMIDAVLVSAQSRKRLFWTNIPVAELPTDRGITLKDILQSDSDVDPRFITKEGKAFCLTSTYAKTGTGEKEIEHNTKTKQRTMVLGHIGTSNGQANRVYSPEGKSVTLSANGGGSGAKTGLYKMDTHIRKLTPIECERLQGLPDNYTSGISNTQRYKCLGNAFNVDVVAHILKYIPKE